MPLAKIERKGILFPEYYCSVCKSEVGRFDEKCGKCNAQLYSNEAERRKLGGLETEEASSFWFQLVIRLKAKTAEEIVAKAKEELNELLESLKKYKTYSNAVSVKMIFGEITFNTGMDGKIQSFEKTSNSIAIKNFDDFGIASLLKDSESTSPASDVSELFLCMAREANHSQENEIMLLVSETENKINKKLSVKEKIKIHYSNYSLPSGANMEISIGDWVGKDGKNVKSFSSDSGLEEQLRGAVVHAGTQAMLEGMAMSAVIVEEKTGTKATF